MKSVKFFPVLCDLPADPGREDGAEPADGGVLGREVLDKTSAQVYKASPCILQRIELHNIGMRVRSTDYFRCRVSVSIGRLTFRIRN